jgi:hypothetical protein
LSDAAPSQGLENARPSMGLFPQPPLVLHFDKVELLPSAGV